MFPGEFDYHKAESLDEAVELLDTHANSEFEVLAGGHSLLPAMKSGLSSPDALIDLGGLDELQGVEMNGDTLSIGATTVYSDFLDSADSWEHAPALAAATREIGDAQVRNRGTVGGNLAHADPASDLPGAALASDVTLIVYGPDGEREIPIDEFFFGMYATDLAPGELVTRIEVPSASGSVGAYAKRPSPSSGYAMIGVATLLDVNGGTVESAGIGANGILDHGVRLDSVAEALVGERLDEDTIEQAASHATDDIDTSMAMDDLQASGEFRTHLLSVYTERALTSAMEEASAPAAAD